jgi:hypothetical protein
VAGGDDVLVRREPDGVAARAAEPMVDSQQVRDLARHPDAGVDQHDQVVAGPFQVRDQVGGQHHAQLLLGGRVHQALQELAAGQRVQGGDRLVQDQQLGPFGDAQGEGELGALPARQLPRLAGGIKTQPSDPVACQRIVPAGVEPGAQLQMVGDAQPGVGGGVLGDEADLSAPCWNYMGVSSA